VAELPPPDSGVAPAGEPEVHLDKAIQERIDRLDKRGEIFNDAAKKLLEEFPDIAEESDPPSDSQLIYKKFLEELDPLSKELETVDETELTSAQVTNIEQLLDKGANELKRLELVRRFDQQIDRGKALADATDLKKTELQNQRLTRLIDGVSGTDRDCLTGQKNLTKRLATITDAQAGTLRVRIDRDSKRLDDLELEILLDDLGIDPLVQKIDQALTDAGTGRGLDVEVSKKDSLKEIRDNLLDLDRRIKEEPPGKQRLTLHNEEKGTHYQEWLNRLAEISSRFREAEPSVEPEPNPLNAETIAKGRVLGFLAPTMSPGADKAFEEKVAQKLAEKRAHPEQAQFEPAHLEKSQHLVASKILQRLQTENPTRYAEYLAVLGDPPTAAGAQEVINKTIEALQGVDKTAADIAKFDEEVRAAIAEELVNGFTQEIDATIDARYKNQRGVMTKIAPMFARVLGIAGGTLGGAAIKHGVMQSAGIQVGAWAAQALGNTVGSTVLATRLASGASGALGGAAAGAISGAVSGMLRGKREARTAAQVTQWVNQLQQRRLDNEPSDLTLKQKASLLKELLEGRERKFLGIKYRERYVDIRSEEDREMVRKIIREHYQKVADQELKAALQAVQKDNNGFTPEQNLARAYTALIESHDKGSETEKNEDIWKHYHGESKKKVWEHVGSGAKRGAIYGAGFGAVFGFLFPANTDIAQTNAQRMINTHALEPIYKHIQHYHELLTSGKASAAEIANAKAQAMSDSLKLDIDMSAMYNVNVDPTTHLIEAKRSLMDLAGDVAKGQMSETKLRALHQLLSHSKVTAESFHSFLDLVSNHGAHHIRGYGAELTQILTRGWDPQSQQHMVGDIFQWLKREGFTPGHLKPDYLGHMPVGGEGSRLIPGLNFQRAFEGHTLLAMFLASIAGAMTAERGDREGKWWWDKDQQAEAYRSGPHNEKLKKTEANQPKGTEPKKVSYSEGIMKIPTKAGRTALHTVYGKEAFDEAMTDYEQMQKDMIDNDRRFIIKRKDPNLPATPDNLVAYRIWMNKGTETKPNTRVGADVHNDADDMERQATDLGAGKGVLATGRIIVREYALNELFMADNDGKLVNNADLSTLEKKWNRPFWLNSRRKTKEVPLTDVLTEEGGQLSGLIISPLEIERYAYALSNPKNLGNPADPTKPGWGLEVGEEPPGGIKQWLADMERGPVAPDATAPDAGTPGPATPGAPPDLDEFILPAPDAGTGTGGTPVIPPPPGTPPDLDAFIIPDPTPPATPVPPVTPVTPPPATPPVAPTAPATASPTATTPPSPDVIPGGAFDDTEPAATPALSEIELIEKSAAEKPEYTKVPYAKELALRGIEKGFSAAAMDDYIGVIAQEPTLLSEEDANQQLEIAAAFNELFPDLTDLQCLGTAWYDSGNFDGLAILANTSPEAEAKRTIDLYLPDGQAAHIELPEALSDYSIDDLKDRTGPAYEEAVASLMPLMQDKIEKAKQVFDKLFPAEIIPDGEATPTPPAAPTAPTPTVAPEPTPPATPEPAAPTRSSTGIIDEAAQTNPNYLAKPEIRDLAITALDYGFSRQAINQYVDRLANGFIIFGPSEERYLRTAAGIKRAYPETDDFNAISEARADYATLLALSTATDPAAETERYLNSLLPGGPAEYMPWPDLLKDTPREMVSDPANLSARQNALAKLSPFIAEKMARAKKISEQLGPSGL
jgi:hypothetical protein